MKNLIKILGLMMVFLFLGTLVSAQDGSNIFEPKVDGVMKVDAMKKWDTLSTEQQEKLVMEWQAQVQEKILKIKDDSDDSDDRFEFLTRDGETELRAMVRDKVEFELRSRDGDSELRIRIRERVADRLEEKWMIRELRETNKCEWLKARVDLAIRVSTENGLTDVVTQLEAAKARIEANCSSTPTANDEAAAEDALWNLRERHLLAQSAEILAKAQEISAKLDNFTTRMANLGRDADDERLAAHIGTLVTKLERLNGKLDERIDALESARATFEADSSKGNAGRLRAAYLSTRAWARISVHAMERAIFVYNHWNNSGDDDLIDAAVDSVPALERASADVDAEVASEEVILDSVVLTDAEVAARSSASVSDDSGNDSSSDILDATETDDSGMDSPSDLDDSDEDNGSNSGSNSGSGGGDS